MGAPRVQGWDEFVGNALCLDFVNTVNDRGEPVADQFEDAASLAAWVDAAGLDTDANAPVDGEGFLERARLLRSSLHAIFTAVLDRASPRAGDQSTLLDVYADACRNATLEEHGEQLRFAWPSGGAEAVLWEVSDSAVRLLQSEALTRLGRCPGCGWLFVDRTKNHSRRWCNMATCGSRHKSRRYYQRHND